MGGEKEGVLVGYWSKFNIMPAMPGDRQRRPPSIACFWGWQKDGRRGGGGAFRSQCHPIDPVRCYFSEQKSLPHRYHSLGNGPALTTGDGSPAACSSLQRPGRLEDVQNRSQPRQPRPQQNAL